MILALRSFLIAMPPLEPEFVIMHYHLKPQNWTGNDGFISAIANALCRQYPNATADTARTVAAAIVGGMTGFPVDPIYEKSDHAIVRIVENILIDHFPYAKPSSHYIPAMTTAALDDIAVTIFANSPPMIPPPLPDLLEHMQDRWNYCQCCDFFGQCMLYTKGVCRGNPNNADTKLPSRTICKSVKTRLLYIAGCDYA